MRLNPAPLTPTRAGGFAADEEEAPLDPVQDDQREQEMRKLLGLARPADATRAGTDAVLPFNVPTLGQRDLPFELKSTTSPIYTTSTARDVGDDHLRKWRDRHWLFGRYEERNGARVLVEMRYGAPDRMAPWIDLIDCSLEPYRQITHLIPRLLREHEPSLQYLLRLLTEVPVGPPRSVPQASDSAAASRSSRLIELSDMQRAGDTYSLETQSRLRRWMTVALSVKGLGMVKALGFSKKRPPTMDHVISSKSLFRDWLLRLIETQLANGRMMNCPQIPGDHILGLPVLDITTPSAARHTLHEEVTRWLERHAHHPPVGLGAPPAFEEYAGFFGDPAPPAARGKKRGPRVSQRSR